ncbi:hypothetical protein [Vibrio ishigakensis]|nr:hypothetical protein [Vibrio ishigakensis]
MNRNSKGHFQKGHQLGGRPKGSRNRFTLAMMDELMQGEDGQLDFHPMLEAKKLYRATDDDRIRVALLKEMLSFGNDKQFTEPEQPEVEEISDDAMKEVYEALKQRFG